MTTERPPEDLSPTRPRPLHRTWLRNRWEDLAFVHWRYDAELVQALLPDGLRVDTFDGSAFVSLIPFRMADASPRFVPAIPWLSSFAETNVRTYVVDRDGNRAIWFFSLEAARLPIVVFARMTLGFPYVWSQMSIHVDGTRRRYETHRRRWPSRPASSNVVEIDIGEAIVEQSPLDVFLTARWGTVARWPGSPRQPDASRGRLRHHPVDHPPWTLHEATLLDYDDRSIEAAGLPAPSGEPIVRWAAAIPAWFGGPTKV